VYATYVFDINVCVCNTIACSVCTCARVCTVFQFVLGDEGGEVELVYEEHLLLDVGFFFAEGEIGRGYCLVTFVFLTHEGLYVCISYTHTVCVYAHPRTHCTQGHRM